MIYKTTTLEPGLFLVSTPIGNSRDITLRALDVLASADVLAAEDTRTLRKLMDIHGVPLDNRRLLSYHDHSKDHERAKILDHVKGGKSVAYASEAGTPLIADPGYKLVADCVRAGGKVLPVPGPSAAVAAISVAGLPTDRFLFAGFLPTTSSARKSALQDILGSAATSIIYESPKRLSAFAQNLIAVAGANHPVVMCREITKRFETYEHHTAQSLSELPPQKGEVVLVLGAKTDATASDFDVDTALRNAMLTMRVKDAVETVSGSLGLPKRDVYQRALELAGKK